MSYDQEQALRDMILEFKEKHRVWDTVYVEITDYSITISDKKKEVK